MQFDVTALESATVVFFATMIIALTLAAFVLAMAFVALVLLGVGTLIWNIVAAIVLGLVHGTNYLWKRAVDHSSDVGLHNGLQGQTGSGRESYRRVA